MKNERHTRSARRRAHKRGTRTCRNETIRLTAIAMHLNAALCAHEQLSEAERSMLGSVVEQWDRDIRRRAGRLDGERVWEPARLLQHDTFIENLFRPNGAAPAATCWRREEERLFKEEIREMRRAALAAGQLGSRRQLGVWYRR
jgi:hypothetical protein